MYFSIKYAETLYRELEHPRGIQGERNAFLPDLGGLKWHDAQQTEDMVISGGLIDRKNVCP